MCECIVQSHNVQGALAPFAQPVLDARSEADRISVPLSGSGPARESLVKPRMRVQAILMRAGQPVTRDVRWGWTPEWSMAPRSPITRLSLEQVLRSPQYARLRRDGRALIPVEGWYETASEGAGSARRQLAYITARHPGPLYLAGLAHVGVEPSGCDGLALVTTLDTAGQQRLVVLDEAHAKAWLAPDLDWEQAQQNVLPHALGVDRLEQLFQAKRGFASTAR
jgi:putative SOS response-associated peptidase YedK